MGLREVSEHIWMNPRQVSVYVWTLKKWENNSARFLKNYPIMSGRPCGHVYFSDITIAI